MIDTLKISNFLNKKYVYKDYKERKLKNATIEILNLCNFNCIHCYNQDLTRFVMNKSLFIHLVDQLIDLGCENVTLTGGEPLLHPDFYDLYKYCWDKGLNISLYTNGYLLNNYVDFLKSYPPKKIDISLYGITNETYKKICGLEKGFDIVSSNVKNLRRLNLPVFLKTVVMQQNYTDLPEMINFCKNEEIYFRFDLNILKSKNGKEEQSYNILTNKQYRTIMNYIKKIKLSNWISYTTRENIYSDNGYLYSCGAGRYSLFVNCHGDVSLCNFAIFSEKNILKHSLKDIWEGFNEYLSIKNNANSKCYKCKYKKFCSNCPVSSYVAHQTNGKLILPVKQNCREAKFIFKSVKHEK